MIYIAFVFVFHLCSCVVIVLFWVGLFLCWVFFSLLFYFVYDPLCAQISAVVSFCDEVFFCFFLVEPFQCDIYLYCNFVTKLYIVAPLLTDLLPVVALWQGVSVDRTVQLGQGSTVL